MQELLEAMGIPYTGSGVSACIRASDKVLAKHAMRDAGIPTPDFFAFSRRHSGRSAPPQALPAIEERLQFPIVVKPAGQGSALGIKFARTAADVPGALVAAFSYDRKVLLERHVAGRDLAVSILEDGGRAAGAADRRGRPASRRTSMTSSRATRSGGRGSSAPPSSTTPSARAGAEIALEVYSLLGCAGFARVDLMLEARQPTSSTCSRPTRSRA